MSEQDEIVTQVLKYLENSFNAPQALPVFEEELKIIESRKGPERYVSTTDVFNVIAGFADALTAKGRESFTPLELQLTLFTLISDVVVDKDIVEVVRCKDCKYYIPQSGWSGGQCSALEEYYELNEVLMYDDDFCSDGERKADNDRN